MLYLTENAANQFRAIRQQKGEPHAALRVSVLGGDCAGLKYFIGLDTFRSADDFVVESDGLYIYLDSTSAPYLWGSEIEWLEVEDEAGFVILNPNKGRSKGGCSSDGEGQGCMTLGDGKHCVKGEKKCKSCTENSQPLLQISLLETTP